MSTETTPLSAVRVEPVVSCRDDMERAWQAKMHREESERRGITEEELWRVKHAMKVAWEEGGGWEAARARLKFAQDFLARQKAANG